MRPNKKAAWVGGGKSERGLQIVVCLTMKSGGVDGFVENRKRKLGVVQSTRVEDIQLKVNLGNGMSR